MANSIEGKALFNRSRGISSGSPITYDASSSTSDQLVSMAYPSHAFYVDDTPMYNLRADSAQPVWREWLLNQTYRPSGGISNVQQAAIWTEGALKDVRKRLQENKLGIFSPAFARFQEGSGNGDGISVTRYFSDSPIAHPFRDLNWHEAFQQLTLNIRDGLLLNNEFNVSLGSGDDVVLGGWQGNSTTKTGAGDDIVLNSPQVFVAELYNTSYIGSIGADYRQWEAYAYYPTAYATRGLKPTGNGGGNSQGNSISTGPGRDLIYYDAGVKTANGGDDDDIIAPSFASFNWGLDTLIQGSGLSYTPDQFNEFAMGNPQVLLYQEPTGSYAETFVRGERALLNPLRNLKQRQKVSTEHTQGYNYNLDGYEFDAQNRESTRADRSLNIRASDKPDGVNFGLKKNDIGIITLDDGEVPILGGCKLLGDKGNDIFYGMDPELYAGFITAADGQGLRLAFRNRADGDSTTQPPRYLPQELRGVKMLGGQGSDYFALGNPSNLDPWSIAQGYDYFYRISGNADEFKNKEDDNFGLNAAPDIFEVSLNYAGENWTNTVTSAPGDQGSSTEPPTAADLAGLGIDGLSAFSGIAGAFGASFPVFDALTAVGSFAVGIASLFAPTPKQPIKSDNSYYADPIGSWRQKISIQDWDPSDSMVIRVDPSDPSASTDRRWDHINFSFQPGSDSSNNSYVDLTYQLASNPSPKTLFRLESIKDSPSSGAWYGWDFTRTTPGFKEIDETNLGFFGQVEMQTGITAQNDPDLASYIDQYGFEVKQGTPLFRWTDASLRNDIERLGRMKSRCERIVAQLDTMTLGYYWDNQFKGNVSSTTDTNPKIKGLDLDKEASKLWIRQDGNTGTSTWKSYSYASLEKDPNLQQYARKATPTWKRQAPAKTELLTHLESLDAEMSGTLEDLVPVMPGARAPRVEARGKLLKSDQFDLTDLNTVTDIVIEGGENPYAVVYHKPAASKNSQIKMLKTIIDNNTVFPTYGLNKDELLLEERKFNDDLDANGLIGRMAPTSGAG